MHVQRQGPCSSLTYKQRHRAGGALGTTQQTTRPRSRGVAHAPILAVLEREPKLSDKAREEAARAQIERLERALLPPSLAGSSSTTPVLPPRVLSCSSETNSVFYFAYGANLNLSTLKRRGLPLPQLRSPAVVVDPSIKLVFKHRGGYSTLQQLQPGQRAKYAPYMEQVHGVLYQIDKQDLHKLTKKEGGYQLIDLEVETYDGWRATAKTFVSGPLAQLSAEVVPTERYMKQLRDGAADNYLDPLYQAWLSSIETVPSVGLPSEYFDTKAKYIAYAFLAIVGLMVAGFFSQY